MLRPSHPLRLGSSFSRHAWFVPWGSVLGPGFSLKEASSWGSIRETVFISLCQQASRGMLPPYPNALQLGSLNRAHCSLFKGRTSLLCPCSQILSCSQTCADPHLHRPLPTWHPIECKVTGSEHPLGQASLAAHSVDAAVLPNLPWVKPMLLFTLLLLPASPLPDTGSNPLCFSPAAGFSQGLRRSVGGVATILGPLWAGGLTDNLFIMLGVMMGLLSLLTVSISHPPWLFDPVNCLLMAFLLPQVMVGLSYTYLVEPPRGYLSETSQEEPSS